MTTNREWLYSLDVADLSDWFDSEHVEMQNDTLETLSGTADAISSDSAVDDVRVTQNGGDAQSNVSENSSDVFSDSREKLEEIATKIALAAADSMGGFAFASAAIDELLLCQTAIHNNVDNLTCEACRAAQKRRIAELEAELSKRDKGIERLKKQRDEAREELREFVGYTLDMTDNLRAKAAAHER